MGILSLDHTVTSLRPNLGGIVDEPSFTLAPSIYYYTFQLLSDNASHLPLPQGLNPGCLHEITDIELSTQLYEALGSFRQTNNTALFPMALKMLLKLPDRTIESSFSQYTDARSVDWYFASSGAHGNASPVDIMIVQAYSRDHTIAHAIAAGLYLCFGRRMQENGSKLVIEPRKVRDDIKHYMLREVI